MGTAQAYGKLRSAVYVVGGPLRSKGFNAHQ
ncbi:MAG: hypothetical protein UZ07_CHB004003457 [Chlorobi bacterium OLB7]|nr:MAG: hypothetical protein UZ07_CHB004003457 [Chlorobi bacterium OLB7]